MSTTRRSFLGLLAKAGVAAACSAVFPVKQLGEGPLGFRSLYDAASHRMSGVSFAVDAGKRFSGGFLTILSAAGDVLWSGPADAGEIVFDAPVNAEDLGYLQHDSYTAESIEVDFHSIEVDFTSWSSDD